MALYFKYVAALVGVLALGVLGIVVFDRLWYQIGLGAAIVVVCGGLLLLAWLTDKKDKAKREDLDRI